MKKIKLGKKIQLLEDFSASDLSKPSQSVTPAAKTKPASITVDKVVAQPTEAPEAPVANVVSGEEVRAEIIKDVDAILNNLDALSKQITEAVLLEADVWFEDDALFESVEAINEEDSFLTKMFAKFKASKAYSMRMGQYSGLKKKERAAEVTKIELEGQFDAKKDQLEAQIKDKIAAKIKTQINKVNQKEITPDAKKAIKDKIYAKRDELEKDSNKKIAEKIKAKKEAVTAKANQAIKAAEAETPRILFETEEVIVEVTAVLVNTSDDKVTVTSFPLLLATTEAPTKLRLEAAVVILEPSSLTVMVASDDMSVIFSSRYFPT